MNIHWKDWCWSWNSNTLATWCEELTHSKRPYCWERLKAGGEGDDRGWDGWMASPTQRTWVWVDSGSWQWTGRPDMLHSMGLQRVRHYCVTELNWTESYQRKGHWWIEWDVQNVRGKLEETGTKMLKKELFLGERNGYKHHQLKRNQEDFKKDPLWPLGVEKKITDDSGMIRSVG